MSSIPESVAAADRNDLKPNIGRVTRFIARWSCSTILLRYLMRRISMSASCSAAVERGMVDFDASLFHHFLELTIAHRVRHIPPDAPQDHVAFKMAALEISSDYSACPTPGDHSPNRPARKIRDGAVSTFAFLAHLRILPETWLSLGRISDPQIRPNPRIQWGNNRAYDEIIRGRGSERQVWPVSLPANGQEVRLRSDDNGRAHELQHRQI